MKPVAGAYLIGGITLISEIALPELPLIQQQSATPHPVQVRLGTVANHLPGAVELDPDCFATPTQYFLNIQGIARYLVTAGREIVIDPDDAAPALDVRGYLLGSIFVVLCQQRGLLPLHASAIAGKSGVVAFLANSGQGKSTLAANLAYLVAHSGSSVLLVDPVDGSLNAKMGIPFFGVMLALLDGPTIGDTVAGCVVNLINGDTWTAIRKQGAKLDGKPGLDAVKSGLGI